MSLFVYVTDSCRNDAVSHGFISEVERLKEQVERKQSTSQFDRFPRPYLVKKKLGGRQGRLIAEEREVGEHVVIVFLAVMIRGHREYESGFARDPEGYGRQHFNGLTDPALLQNYVDERTREDPVTPKPVPSHKEYQLLYSAFKDPDPTGAGDMVFETREWIDAVFQERIQKQLALFAKPVTAALSGQDGLFFAPIDGKSDWGVWVYRCGRNVVLLTPSTDDSAHAAKATAEQLASDLASNELDAVLRASRRAYPQIVLADDELWLDLEGEREANLALSPEESQVLQSTRESANPFPLFINGRAGSGKSTILQYLFANYLHNYRRSAAAPEVSTPIYLTANAELLRVARRVVERLLRKELAIAGGGEEPSKAELDELLGPAFQEFYTFVGSFLPGGVRKSRFAPGKRLDYTGFRARWMERFGKEPTALREFGPDVSWHVIRTYIKGRSSETLLDPKDYEQLADSERSVSSHVYKLVYERVWEGWYQDVCTAQGFWDDQDLVRFVLESELGRPTFPAVFCDEAQDFTRLELELLLRINLFSDRSLPTTDLSRVCFVFAGDQFQTLNPTGFRWDAIKATFVEKFILELDPGRRSGRMDLNYRELEFNYRSARRIVRFSNHVQAIRAALFGIPDLRPQTPWLKEPREFPVVAFNNHDGAFWNRFKESAGWIVIVPCADGEETRYVNNDPVLRERIRIEDGVPQNVLSASRAKGCEYADVVVYGFGKELETSIENKLKERAEKTREENDLALEYFINRLYVAVSRAKRRLVIVDTEDGFQKLWRTALDENAEANLLSFIKNGQAVWGGAIEGMSRGRAEDLTRDVASDPRENAAAFERDGLSRKDAFLMRQAGQAYRAADDLPKARECRAKAFEFELRFIEAGAAFVEAGDGFRALRCYWSAGPDGWAELVRLKDLFPDVERELEYRFARALKGESSAADALRLVDQFLSRCADSDFAERYAGSASWQRALEQVVREEFRLDADGAGGRQPSPTVREAARMVDCLARARELGFSVSPDVEGSVNYRAEHFAEAVRLWDLAGSTTSVWYARARARSDPYPQRVVALAKLKEWQEIVDDFRRDSNAALTVEQATAVVEALTERGQLSDALQLGWRTQAVVGLAVVGERALKAKESEIANRAMHAWVAAAVPQCAWDVIAWLFDSDVGTKGSGQGGEAFRAAAAEQRSTLRLTFVRAFARSGSLSTASDSIARKVAEFLRERLRMRDGDWRAWVSVEEAGAAIERAGRFTDALAFYDAVRKQSPNGAEQEFAKRRRLVAVNRQLAYEKSKRESGQTRQLERDLRQAMASLRIQKIEELPEFPALEPIDLSSLGKAVSAPMEPVQTGNQPDTGAAGSSPERPDRVSCQVGDFSFDLSRSAKRLNITKAQSMEQAFVKVGDRQCGGEGGMRRVSEREFAADAWGLTIRMSTDGGRDSIEIALKDVGAKLILTA